MFELINIQNTFISEISQVYRVIPNIDPEFFIYIILGFILVISLFIREDSIMIYKILNILLIYFLSGIIFIVAKNEYLGFMYLIIYPGAIVVLIIYVLILISNKFSESTEKKSTYLFKSFVLSIYIILLFFNDFFGCKPDYFFFVLGILTPYFSKKNKKLFQRLPFISQNTIIDKLLSQKVLFKFLFSHDVYSVVKINKITLIGKILFSKAYLETLILGFILILVLIIIIYLFRK